MNAGEGNKWYDGDWDELVVRAEGILEDVARRDPDAGGLTYYSELNESLGRPFDFGTWRGQQGMSVLLAEISTRSFSDPSREAMLSAVVLSKSGGMPGAGFYKLARDLGRMSSGEGDVEFYMKELTKVREVYKEN